MQELLELAKTGREYIDCHVWVWTPQELLDQLRTVAALDLCGFTVYSIIPTPDNDIEFFLPCNAHYRSTCWSSTSPMTGSRSR